MSNNNQPGASTSQKRQSTNNLSNRSKPKQVKVTTNAAGKRALTVSTPNNDVTQSKITKYSWSSNPQHIAGELKQALHGNDYQLKLLMLFAWEAKCSQMMFRVATEMSEAEKFDDLVFRYTNTSGQVCYRFLQAKHRQFLHDGNKIKVSDLMSTRDTDFSLQKYFVSFLKDTEKFRDGYLEDFIICTNTDFDFTGNVMDRQQKRTKANMTKWKDFLKLQTVNDQILNLGGEHYKFSDDPTIRVKIIAELEPIFKNALSVQNVTCNNLTQEINAFLDKLLFAVKQSSEQKDLENIIKDRIGEEFNLLDAITYNSFFKYMYDWMQHRIQGKDGEKATACYLTHNDIEKFFNAAKHQIASLSLIGPTLQYCSKIQSFNVIFDQTAIDQLSQLNHFLADQSNKKVFNLIAEQTLLSAIKVLQILKTKSEYQKDGSFIFIRLRSLLLVKDRVLHAFRSNGNNLLVIECNKSFKNNLHQNLLPILNFNKKIVLISKPGDNLAKKFQNTDLYMEENDGKNGLVDVTTESKMQILSNGKIFFQGFPINLKTLLDPNADQLMHLIDAEIMAKLMKNKEKIEIGREFTTSKNYNASYYISQTLKRCVSLKESFKIDPHFLIIENTDEIRTQINRDQNIILVSSREEHFTKICENHSVTVHWLKSESGNYFWQKSNGPLAKLREYFNDVTSNTYELNFLDSIGDRIVIIAANPGMGKSTLLSHVILTTKMQDPPLWIIRINLLDYSREFRDWRDNKKTIDRKEVDKFLRNIVSFENEFKLFEEQLFEYFFNEGKIAILFDGFDEISPNYKAQVIDLLKVLKETRVQKIWITTRPYNIQNELEDSLLVLSYQLLEFSPEEQRLFLQKVWTTNLSLDAKYHFRLQSFISIIFEKFTHSINDQEFAFMSVPLQITMVARIFQRSFQEYYPAHGAKLSDELEENLSKKLTLTDLYKEFFKIKFTEIHFEEKNCVNSANPVMEDVIEKEYREFIENHKKLALLALFEEDSLDTLFNEEEMDKIYMLIDRIKQGSEKSGIVDGVVNNKPMFVHLSYAEYFVGKYFWDRFKFIRFKSFETILMKSLIETIVQNDKLQICKFFQSEAQHDLELAVNILEKDRKFNIFLKHLVEQVNSNCNESFKLILKIVEVEMNTNCTKINGNLEFSRNDKALWKLVNTCADSGYKEIAKVLLDEHEFDIEFLQDDLKADEWRKSALWLAAHNRLQEVVEIFIKKLSYNSRWRDSANNILIQNIIQRQDFDMLNYCLELSILNGEPYIHISSRKYCLPLLEILDRNAPENVVASLLKNTEMKDANGLMVSESTEKSVLNLLNYSPEIIEALIQKGLNFAKIMNKWSELLIDTSFISTGDCDQFEVVQTKTHDTLKNLVDKILMCFKNGVGFNFGPNTERYSMLKNHFQNVQNIYDFIQKLNKMGQNFCPNDIILKLIIECLSKKSFENFSFEYRDKSKLVLVISNSSASLEITILTTDINLATLPTCNSEDINDALQKLPAYINNALVEIAEFKNNFKNDLDSVFKFLFAKASPNMWIEFCEKSKIVEKKHEYQSLNDFVKFWLDAILKLYVKKNVEINEALQKTANALSMFVKVQKVMPYLAAGERKVSFNVRELFDHLDLNTVQQNDKELDSLLDKMFENDRFHLLTYTWSVMAIIGQGKTLEILEKILQQKIQTLNICERWYLGFGFSFCGVMATILSGTEERLSIFVGMEAAFKKTILDSQDKEYGSPLHYVASINDVKSAEVLLAHSANFFNRFNCSSVVVGGKANYKMQEGYSPLHVAVEAGHLEMVELLLANGMDVDIRSVNSKGKYGKTPLHLATSFGHLSIVKYLLDKGANFNVETVDGETAFYLAVKHNRMNIVELLIQAGCDISIANYNKESPLFEAVRNGQLDIVVFLISQGCSIHAVNNANDSLLHEAIRGGHLNVAEKLVEHGIDVNLQNYSLETSLRIAIMFNYLTIVEFLLRHHANVNVSGQFGETPLQLAKKLDYTDIVKLLLEAGAIENITS